VTTRAAESQGADRAVPGVTMRYWAGAKHAAGVAEDVVPAATLSEALAAVRALHGDSPRFGSVLGVCSFLVGSEPVGSRDAGSVALANGDVVDVLPPFAGG
jgi:molybdopterin synthase sulfur carrier subunit